MLKIPSTALSDVESALKATLELVGHITPLHDLSKLTGVRDFTADVFPKNPATHAHADIDEAPINVWLLPGGQTVHGPTEPLAA